MRDEVDYFQWEEESLNPPPESTEEIDQRFERLYYLEAKVESNVTEIDIQTVRNRVLMVRRRMRCAEIFLL